MHAWELARERSRNCASVILGIAALWASACSDSHSSPVDPTLAPEASVPDLASPRPDLGSALDAADGPLKISDASVPDGMPLADARPLLDRGDDSPTCHYAPPPSVSIDSSNSSQSVSSVKVLKGPCLTDPEFRDYGTVVWLSSPDCPQSPMDQIVCQIEVRSNRGSTAIVSLFFVPEMLGIGSYWSSAKAVSVTFPTLDGGLDAPAPDGAVDQQG